MQRSRHACEVLLWKRERQAGLEAHVSCGLKTKSGEEPKQDLNCLRKHVWF